MDLKLSWSRNRCEICWNFGEEVKKSFQNPPESVIRLSDKSGIAVVLSSLEFGKTNAVVYNNDGSERYWLTLPSSLRDIICFHEIYYVNEILTAMVATSECDFACEINEQTGNYIRIYETR